MRLVLVISVLAASATVAQAAEDRYGPPPVAATAVMTAASYGARTAPTGPGVAAAPYAGRMLGWSGKASPAAPPPVFVPQTAPQPAPRPVAAAVVTPAPAPPAPRGGVQPSLYPSTYRAMPTGAAVGAVRPAAQPPLPTSLYDRPAPTAQTPPVPQAARAVPTPTPAPVVTPPRAQAAATLPPAPSAVRAPAPTPTTGAKAGWSPPKYYSVHRQFGEAPDPITIPPPTSYWVDRVAAQAPAAGETASAPDDYPVGGVGNEPEDDRPAVTRVRTVQADGSVKTTIKRADR